MHSKIARLEDTKVNLKRKVIKNKMKGDKMKANDMIVN